MGSALTERTLYRRAVEAAIWGMPLVSFGSMRHAYFHDAGAHYNDMVYWSNPDVWRKQTPAPHQTAVALLFANLRGGPLLLEVPPLRNAVAVSLFDAWSVPLPRAAALEGESDKGAKYVLVPPDRAAYVPAGYIPVHSPTFDVGCSIRIAPEAPSPKELVRASILVKKLRIRPLLISASTPPSRFIDMTHVAFDGVPRGGAEFFASLAHMVGEELPREEDAAMLGLLGTLGIRKGGSFQPTPEMTELFGSAVAEGVACLQEGRRSAGYRYWPTRRWRASLPSEGDAASAQRRDTLGAESVVGALDLVCHETNTLCLSAFEDGRGEMLDGSNTYVLRVPADVPTRRFWTVAAYDEATAAFIRQAPVVGVSSRGSELTVNPDGSVDLYFAPRRPFGEHVNWIATAEGRRFFVVFRNHGPERYVLAHTSRWTLGDLERSTDPAVEEKSPVEDG